jgi:Domain of unknown function (DUF4452)
MSSFFYGGHHQQHHGQNPHSMGQQHHGHGRSRRAPRLSASQNSHRQYRNKQPVKDMSTIEPPNVTAFRARFEAGRSFDLDDDLEFCPHLLTFDDVNTPNNPPKQPLRVNIPVWNRFTDNQQRQSIRSASSDRSSLSSGSPESSPLQQQIQPQQQITPALSLSSAATSAYAPPPSFISNNNNLKIFQPSARKAGAIPIVNPNTGMRVASPPSSVSPGMMGQTSAARRGW